LPKLYLVMLIAIAMSGQPGTSLTEQVRRAEIAFAKTMADRDHVAFTSFLAEEAVFVGTNRVFRSALWNRRTATRKTAVCIFPRVTEAASTTAFVPKRALWNQKTSGQAAAESVPKSAVTSIGRFCRRVVPNCPVAAWQFRRP
jgi:hypothetical protein